MTELEEVKSFNWIYGGYKESGTVRDEPLGSYI
jgi:hypothetical protein